MLAVLRQERPEWEVHVVLGQAGPIIDRATDLGATVEVIPFPVEIAGLGDSGRANVLSLLTQIPRVVPSVFAYRDQLRAALNRYEPSIIHSNGFKMHVLGAMAKPRKSELVWHMHDYISPRRFIVRLLRYFAKRTDATLAVSTSVAEDVRLCLGPRHKVIPILNVADLQTFSSEGPRLDLDSLSGIAPAPQNTVRVGLLATMAWWKGHRLFLDALAKIKRDLPIRAYIIGGALYQTRSKQETIDGLRQYAERVGVADRVGFTGYLDNPAAAMRALDVVVHASTEPEPFGRVIVEAMACGKPVISSGVGGAGEILMMGDFALAFKLNDPVSLAKAITKLVNDPDLRRSLGRNGLHTARARFGRERLARELLAVYEEV
jgi:glycosyltransferase involved in cell wall biosynthesis